MLSLNSKYSNTKKNIVTYNFGLSDKNESLLCSFDSTNIGGTKIKTPNYDTSSHDKQIYIDVKITDEINALQEESISLIKIDVEGGELGVLKGARNLINRCKPVVVFEHGLGAADVYGTKPEQVYDLLSGEYGMQVSLMKNWLMNKPSLEKTEFSRQFNEGENHYFIVYFESN